MKSFYHLVSPVLIGQYVEICRAMSRAIFSGNPGTVAYLNKRRAEIHEEILRTAGVSRDDKEFSFWLATVVEPILDEGGDK